jgi:hypothetical protein
MNQNPLVAVPPTVEAFPQFTAGNDVDPSITRYLFFPGDIIGTRRKQEMKDLDAIGISVASGGAFKILQNGGDELGSPCLVRTKGFIPRAFITPLEVGAFWTPPEFLPDGYPAFSGVHDENGRGAKNLVGEKKFPGEAIHWILTSSQNDQGMRRGAVELTPLRAVEWKDYITTGLQRLFFSEYPKLPAKLADLEFQIRAIQSNDADAISMRDQMLASCEEFRDWGMSKIAIEHTLVKMGTIGEGWTYTYSDLAQRLMEQLDITPQDQQFATVAKMQEEMARSTMAMMASSQTGTGDTSAVLRKLMESQEMIARTLGAIAEKMNPVPVAPKSK